MCDVMIFPKTWEEFERSYGFIDKDEVYTNGARLIPSFRVEQWLEHLETLNADTEPVRHGKWLYGENESGHDGYYCSQCGKHIRWIYGEENIDFIRSYNYCPNCGAKMEVEEDE